VTTRLLTTLALFTFLCTGVRAQSSGNNVFATDVLHEINLTFADPDYWETMTDNFGGGFNPGVDHVYVMAAVTIDGETTDSIGVRFKGFTSFTEANKRPMKLDFNEFVRGRRVDGLRKLNLNNATADPGMQRDVICYDLMNRSGVSAPRTAYARVSLNGEFWGLYQMIEQVDKEFLQNNFDNAKGNLFKNLGWYNFEYQGDSPENYLGQALKTNREGNDYSGFINFTKVLNDSTATDFPEAIEAVFNVDRYLKVLAVDVATNNWDSNLEHGRNWYIYEDTVSGKFQWIPWDYNLALGGELLLGGGGECFAFADVAALLDGTTTVQFLDAGLAPPDADYIWTFGDGSPETTEKDPVHTYAEAGEYEVCYKVSNGPDCYARACRTINTANDLNDCAAVTSGDYGGPADGLFARLLTTSPDCCDEWGEHCESLKVVLSSVTSFGGGSLGGGGTITFEIDQRANERTLIKRLLAVPEFYDRYLGHFCTLMERHFVADRYADMIADNRALIEPAVRESNNYLYTLDQFEADLDPAAGMTARITNRIEALKSELDVMGVCGESPSSIPLGDIVINEFVADNDSLSGISDPDGGYPDWIELYNNTDAEVDLSGAFLSDKADNLDKWSFPDGTTIAADGYLIIWADEDEDQEGLHANFKLGKNGEAIYLSNAGDSTRIDEIVFGVQEVNVPMARFPNGTGDFRTQHATHGFSNDTPVSTRRVADALAIRVYPNPAGNQLTVDLPTGSDAYTIDLFSITGQAVFAGRRTSGATERLNVGQLVPGFYLLRVVDGEGRRGTVKFAKQ